MALDQHINNDSVIRPCCHYDVAHWPDPTSNIDRYWKSQGLHLLRGNMMSGIRDSGCRRCWILEDQKQISMRMAVNKERLKEIDIENPVLTQVKMLTGKTWNLACMMCFPTISSTINQLWGKEYPWNLPVVKKKNLDYDWNMDTYIRNNCDTLKYIEALGGEPLFNKDFLRLLTYLADEGASERITLFLITNGTIITPDILSLLQKFQQVVFAVSIDGVGKVNEYQRWPSDWAKIEHNLAKIREHFDLSVLPTVTALNIARLHELYEYCDRQNITINNMTVVAHWPALLPTNLPQKIRSMVDTRFRPLIDSAEGSDQRSLVDFVNRWDQQRNISISSYMPEWESIISSQD